MWMPSEELDLSTSFRNKLFSYDGDTGLFESTEFRDLVSKHLESPILKGSVGLPNSIEKVNLNGSYKVIAYF